jgi:hypothetical protein
MDVRGQARPALTRQSFVISGQRRFLRGPSESYSGVILQLVEIETKAAV